MLLSEECPIVVVEDDPAILGLVIDLLEDEDYPILTVSNGRKAVEMIVRLREAHLGSPPLILLDMQMPVLDGWGVARELRERGLLVPIIVMTAAQNAHAWADEIGAEGYLSKPFDLEDLLSEVRRVLAARQPLPV